MSGKLLFVEDEQSLARLVSLQLQAHGFVIDLAFDGQQAQESILKNSYDLILLDRMMPNGSGLDVLKFIRQKAETPVIFVTALNAPEHIIEGLEAGADDYVTKPFDERVLVSRIKSVMRRSKNKNSEVEKTGDWISVGDISLNPKSFEAKVKEDVLQLTRSEFLLLQSLMEDKGCVQTRKHLISMVQGEDVNVTGRTVDTHIFGLRKKLAHCADMIETIRGVGYRMHSDIN